MLPTPVYGDCENVLEGSTTWAMAGICCFVSRAPAPPPPPGGPLEPPSPFE